MFCQESTFLYDENPAAVVSKEINHDVLYREGRTMTVSTALAFDQFQVSKCNN